MAVEEITAVIQQVLWVAEIHDAEIYGLCPSEASAIVSCVKRMRLHKCQGWLDSRQACQMAGWPIG